MDALTATALLISNLTRLAEFGAAISAAHAEGRNLTPEEVAKASAGAQASLDALDAQIKAAGG